MHFTYQKRRIHRPLLKMSSITDYPCVVVLTTSPFLKLQSVRTFLIPLMAEKKRENLSFARAIR